MMRALINRTGWIIAAALGVFVIGTLAGVVHGGPLDPPGPPASTMKTLQDIEPRTPIKSLPFTISSGGSYYLTGDVTGSPGGNGIIISADNVTLDLGGFALIGPGGAGTEVAITSSGPPRNNVTVRNGVIREWGGAGVVLSGSVHQLTDLQVTHNGFNSFPGGGYGLQDTASKLVVTDSIVAANGPASGAGGGILLGSQLAEVRRCMVSGNVGAGIVANFTSVIEDNVVRGQQSGPGIDVTGQLNRVVNNDVGANGTIGIKVDSFDNVIVKNSATLNSGGNFSIAAGNTVGAIGAFGTPPTDPWGNLQY